MNENIKESVATFAAGCFWGIEDVYSKVNGATQTTVGYIGGERKNPTYDEVCTGETGHAEAVQVVFDPRKVSYNDLLRVFWSSHDPTSLNKQGPDVGTQYRSAIFYHSAEQKKAAHESKEARQRTDRESREIVTEITEAGTFYPAEEYHQKYFQKTGKNVYA